MEKKMRRETSIRIADTVDNTAGKVFEYNVNMSVSLSNSKRSKIFQRTQSLVIVLMTVAFFLLFSQLRREVRALEAQMNSMNSNLVILMLRYERLNRLNRLNYYRKPQGIPAESPAKLIIDSDHRKDEIKRDDEDHSSEGPGKLHPGRFERSVVMFDSNNVTDVATISDNQGVWSDARGGRAKREEVRGKQRRKIKRRPKRSRRRLGPLVATFVGAVPEQHVTDTVYIGPWVKRNETRYGFNKFHLVEDKRSIEVTANGLYMISAQIYYYGEKTHYSYWILLSSEGSSTTRKIIKCATVSAVSATEASCHTSVILPLRRGDRLHIQQQERNRLINLREGHSYVQVMLLSSDQQKRRLTT
ncbi:uncharacterized protein LOC107043138 isoform X2 [Diachasma alloeum]|uniref:uncharacterized protein LOC107043138 isoform X2 n=1 Tax=Diachasma alloeum TaxID=454923 RepID=UPI00073847DF|nr:uncharacterized protein LOC107043138 isoform X2 [Diachasma alloeum]